MNTLHLNDSNFNSQVISSEVPVLVDFWAEWCGPCKKMAPVVDELSKEYTGKVKIAKVNVDSGKEAAAKFGIMSIPTFILFKNGKVVKQIIGVVSKDELKSVIDRSI